MAANILSKCGEIAGDFCDILAHPAAFWHSAATKMPLLRPNFAAQRSYGAPRYNHGPKGTAMREARLIAPMYSNQNAYLGGLLLDLEKTLLEHFGGFTRITGSGTTLFQEGAKLSERVQIYDIAMLDDDGNSARLRAIALWYGKRAEQDEVYVRYASGDVELVSTLDATETAVAPKVQELA